MTVISHQLDAGCPPERIWDLLAALDAVPRFNPGVRAARVRGGQARGIGAVRECELVPRGRIAERVTLWEEGRALGLEVVESDWPLHFMRWVTRVEPASAGSRLSQRLEYRVKFGPLGWVLDRLLMRRKIAGAVETALRGMVRAAETAP
jgi:hypothetical protein